MADNYQVMLLDPSDVPSIDFTTTRALEDIISDTINAGQQIILLGAGEDVYQMLRQQGVLKYVEACNIFDQRIDALQRAQEIIT